MFGNEKFFSSGAAASSGTFYPFELNNSLKFEDGDSSYLSRTPTSAGNRRTWTWSAWVKRANIGSSMALFTAAQSGGTQRSVFRFTSDNEIQIGFNPTGSTWYYLYTDAVYRDTSSWYHIVLSFDTTQATSSNRTKLYVNGELQTFRSASYLSQNTEGPINNTIAHSIGRYQAAGSALFDGYLAEVNFIDGTALDPTSFGETKEGIWVPKDPAGLTYGTNGFRLPFTETTTANGFNTVTYSGNGATQSVEGVGFKPDFVWVKERTSSSSNVLTDSVRGVQKILITNATNTEASSSTYLKTFDSDGFTVGTSGAFNASTDDYVAWCWGGGTNDKTYTVTVVSDSGNKYRFDGHGTSSITLNLTEGATYTFNYPSAHPLRFSTTSDGTHGGGSEYTTGVTHVSSTQTTITVASGAPTLYYYCSLHSGMGGQINTNTTDAPTYAEGTILSRVKPNATYGFSIATYTGTGSAGSFGHGLSSAPTMVIVKRRNSSPSWQVFHTSNGAGKSIELDGGGAAGSTTSVWNNTVPSSTVVNIGTHGGTNASGGTYVAYSFADVTGHQKAGTYSGNGSASGATVTTGFRPAWVMVKRTDSSGEWIIFDNTRDTDGSLNTLLYASLGNAEGVTSLGGITPSATGFQVTSTLSDVNASGGTFIYLAIADTRNALFTSDASSNSNNWKPNDLQHSDVMPDTPTNGFAILNSIDKSSSYISEGNLKIGAVTNSWNNHARAGFFVNSGKWYWEIHKFGSGGFWKAGIRQNGDSLSSSSSSSTGKEYYAYNGYKQDSSTNSSYGSAVATGSILAFALDLDAGTITAYVDNVSQGVMFSGLTGSWSPTYSGYNGQVIFNFGQDSSFTANKIAQGNTDDNGKGDFFYAPPSGYLALCNANLPDPAIDPNAGNAPEDHFNTVLYTGTGSSGHAITGVGFQADWIWIKNRSNAINNIFMDSVRGITNKILNPDVTNAELTATVFNSVGSDGFEFASTGLGTNASGSSYVAWNWKAGGTAVSNTDGSITSTVSANTDAGLSIVSFDLGATGSETVGHGLGVAPDVVLIKARNSTSVGWLMYHRAIASDAETDYIVLNSTAAASDNNTVWDDTAPTSSVFTIGSGFTSGTYGVPQIAYCFAEKDGYSKFGSYTGNGSTNGTFVYTGFRPAFVMVKRTNSTGSWQILDNTRSTFNVMRDVIYANLTNAEAQFGSGTGRDFLSNGFKLRNTSTSENASGSTYIYMAFAEQPFKYSNAR